MNGSINTDSINNKNHWFYFIDFKDEVKKLSELFSKKKNRRESPRYRSPSQWTFLNNTLMYYKVSSLMNIQTK